ncbi:Rho-type GTPAse-activating protein 2 [Lasiodiplodia theobromae]|uniref:N-chimaerin n=1 Tax=Lasiodiplodia theobromae TaxID=45133 RepID=A0A5N5DJ55_9PEZI|nr:Rho-type GTPAse-activating protein 2 [Lasiodiplodia theobromae]KAB2577938.1 N-chimaerin [Lasiodiplodia theobromae]KAF4538025.1 Rho-type GTPAse-activating protein 2 [Lasiodiplodia theobromae]
MESPGAYPDSPGMDDMDVIYHCKGCGEILEEGKAFELAGNRWHIDCFRCNTCGTLLDSDANLLLLGDGSLICNNCTYSCSACNNKIEDLAILTGDQAFCASCFRCRNCKRKIENLRYARTSQGIFCMSCHESLMARRRKKTKANRQQAENKAPAVLDKSLPALPPGASHFSPDLETPPEIETPEDLPHRPRAATSGANANLRREASPASDNSRNEPQTLPASTYREKRRSAMPMSTNFDDPDGMFANVPFALDPNPAPGPSPLADSRTYNLDEDKKNQRDYFNGGKPGTTSHRELLKESRSGSSRSSSLERRSKSTSSPHIAFQEKGRAMSGDRVDTMRRKEVPSSNSSPSAGNERPRAQHSTSASTAGSLGEGFKLQEVPKDRKATRTRSRSELRSPDDSASSARKDASESSAITSPVSTNSSYTPTSQDYERGDEPQPMSAPFSAPAIDRPKRGDSLGAQRSNTGGHSSPSTPTGPRASHERKPSANSALANRDVNTLTQMNGGLTISKPVESPTTRSILDGPPPRSGSRPVHGSNHAGESFTTPRAPPHPPQGTSNHRPQDSLSSTISDGSTHPMSPSLLRYSAGGDFSVDEDMARIFRDNEENHSSSLSQKWKSPHNGSVDIGSPSSASPDTKDESFYLKAQLRQAQQRIAELEADNSKLNESASRSSDIKQVNSELKEKRSTIAVLDTQREVVMRELDIMTEHLKAAKDQQRPLDLQAFQSAFFRDFAAELEKFKAKIRTEIEELVQKRNEVNDDILNLIKMKDKGYQEYESLSQKNTQLAELNNQLVQTIQDLYKSSNRGANGQANNALGIQMNNGKDKDVSISDIQKAVQEHQMNQLADNMDESTVLQPRVVQIKSKGNKFNWKKGGQAVAKNVTKGLKGAFASQQPMNQHDGLTVGGVPYGAIQAGVTPSLEPAAGAQKGGERGFGGFFGGGQKAVQKPIQKPSHHHNNSTTQLSAAETLFGSDLSERCEFEKATIPSIVRRCIQEVELRGVDVEGIYRKSGGSGQVNQVRLGFEKDAEYDISDPDLDIHAVTSALKQYFRRLPNPLITFEVYDELLAAGQIQDVEKLVPAMRLAIDSLPQHHRDCLEFLVFHLARVMEHKKDNLMTAVNIAVVFAPTVMRPQSIEREMTDMGPQRTAIQALLEHNKGIFAPEAEVSAPV